MKGHNQNTLRSNVVLSGMFRSHGYMVQQDVELVGASGRKYAVDMVARTETPRGKSAFVMTVCDGPKGIGKKDVKEMANMLNDLGYGTGVITTTAGISSAASKAADRRGIMLVDESVLRRLGGGGGQAQYGFDKHLEPSIGEEEAKSRVGETTMEKLVRNLWSRGKPKPKVPGVRLIYYPYYQATIEYEKEEARRLRREVVRQRIHVIVCVDARIGAPVFCHKGKIMHLPGNDCSGMIILRQGKNITGKTRQKTGLDRETFDFAMRGLEKGKAVATLHRNPLKCQVKKPFSDRLRSITECHAARAGKPDGTMADVRVSWHRVKEMLEVLGGNVIRIDTVYVPYHHIEHGVEGQTEVKIRDAMKWEPVPDDILDSFSDAAGNRRDAKA